MSNRPVVLDAIRATNLIAPWERVLVMVSGGADSVGLLDALRELYGPDALVALHVNHGLREAAGEDERHCAEVCERLGVRLEVEQVEVPRGGNLEARAREARYEAAERVRARLRLDLVATGHTADDQLETVLYRLATSPGRRALLGMRPRTGTLVRPLLGVGREQVRAYCRERGLEWREDETNQDRRFARNRLRLDVLPALRAIHPAALENVLATVEELRDEAELLDAAVDEAADRVATGGPEPAVDANRLAELAPPLRRLVLRRVAEQAAGESLPLSARRVQEIEQLASRGGSGSLDLGGGLRVVAEYGVLRFQRDAGDVDPEPAVLAVPGECRFGDWQLACVLEGGASRDLGSTDEPLLDASKLAGELTVRSWRDGDRMRPLGLSGTKSLQDLFTDSKVPRALRRRLPVIESDGEIVWVAGVALSERFKVTVDTGRAARLRASALHR